MSTPKTIRIDNVEYIPADSVDPRPTGNRAVMVLDRGWIYAGDVERRDGRIYLTRVVWVFRWESIGFDGVVDNPSSKKVHLRPMKPLDFPADVELFCVPVHDSWGLGDE